jgi:hypothetical protein
MNPQVRAELRVIAANKKVDKLVAMIESIIFKHPYTAAMFEEELKIAGAWPLKQKQNHGNNEGTTQDDTLHSIERKSGDDQTCRG